MASAGGDQYSALVVGPEDGSASPVTPMQRLLDNVHEIAGVGTLFPDEEGRMNLSVRDIEGGLLLVPQFTLTADTKKGTRASFTKGAPPEKASEYFDRLVIACRGGLGNVETGRFGANMQVSLTNDGPVTFWLDTGGRRRS